MIERCIFVCSSLSLSTVAIHCKCVRDILQALSYIMGIEWLYAQLIHSVANR